MAISVSYQPAASTLVRSGLAAGQGVYDERRRQEQLQRDLEAARLADSRYRADLSVANDQFLAAYGAAVNQATQLRGFQNANYSQEQQIADAQRRAQMGIDDAQFRQGRDIASQQLMQERGFEQQTKLADQSEALSRWQTEFGGTLQRDMQAQQINAQMQQLQSQIQAATQRQQYDLAAQAMNQMRSLQAQQAMLGQQQQFQGQMAQFNLGGDLLKGQQQGALSSMLSQQQYRQNVGLAGVGFENDQALQQLRGVQQQDLTRMELAGRADQATNSFLMENLLGPYAGYADTISARQASLQQQQLQTRMQNLDQFFGGDTSDPYYQQARNDLMGQFLGLQQRIGLDRTAQQAMFEEGLVEFTTPAGNKIQLQKTGSGYMPIEDPFARFADNANQQKLRVQQEMQALQWQMRASAMEMAIKAAGENPALIPQYFNASMQMLGFQAEASQFPSPSGIPGVGSYVRGPQTYSWPTASAPAMNPGSGLSNLMPAY